MIVLNEVMPDIVVMVIYVASMLICLVAVADIVAHIRIGRPEHWADDWGPDCAVGIAGFSAFPILNTLIAFVLLVAFIRFRWLR